MNKESNNKYSNTEAELKKLEEFDNRLEVVQKSFSKIYGEKWVRKFKRDNFRPENIEKLLLNVLLLKDVILDEGGLLDLARTKKLDIEKSLYYAPTKPIFKEVERRIKKGSVYYQEQEEDDRKNYYGLDKGNKYLLSYDNEYPLLLEDKEEKKVYFCYGCDRNRGTGHDGRSLCDECLEEELEIVKIQKGLTSNMPKLECVECKEIIPILKYRRKLIDPETKICWRCKEEKEEETEE